MQMKHIGIFQPSTPIMPIVSIPDHSHRSVQLFVLKELNAAGGSGLACETSTGLGGLVSITLLTCTEYFLIIPPCTNINLACTVTAVASVYDVDDPYLH
jgi:hypothetical protein